MEKMFKSSLKIKWLNSLKSVLVLTQTPLCTLSVINKKKQENCARTKLIQSNSKFAFSNASLILENILQFLYILWYNLQPGEFDRQPIERSNKEFRAI